MTRGTHNRIGCDKNVGNVPHKILEPVFSEARKDIESKAFFGELFCGRQDYC